MVRQPYFPAQFNSSFQSEADLCSHIIFLAIGKVTNALDMTTFGKIKIQKAAFYKHVERKTCSKKQSKTF